MPKSAKDTWKEEIDKWKNLEKIGHDYAGYREKPTEQDIKWLNTLQDVISEEITPRLTNQTNDEEDYGKRQTLRHWRDYINQVRATANQARVEVENCMDSSPYNMFAQKQVKRYQEDGETPLPLGAKGNCKVSNIGKTYLNDLDNVSEVARNGLPCTGNWQAAKDSVRHPFESPGEHYSVNQMIDDVLTCYHRMLEWHEKNKPEMWQKEGKCSWRL